MTDDRLLEDFSYLFAGNNEAWGTESGGCVRKPPPWEDHLFGSTPIGIYPTYKGYDGNAPLPPHRSTNWGCIDLDVRTEKKPSGDYDGSKDAHTAAINLTRALGALGLKGWIEQTRSDGRHVWVFKRTNMQTMRAALLVACQLAKVKPTEVNPKSFELGPDELGNYVRLPYPAKSIQTQYVPTTDRRRVFDTNHSFWPVSTFVSAALEGVNDLSALEAAAKLYKAPSETAYTAVSRPSSSSSYDGAQEAPRGLYGLPRKIWNEGSLEGADRSGTLFKMAVAMVKQGFPVDAIATTLEATDLRWFQKYTTRRDPWKWYVETAQNAQLANG